ncbi:stage II sporulation protein B [Bacillus clarus]|uniref:Stage II sporulation protein B n=1 Tax=Bacillus clarus TaxID=2338372 RepID=A0A090YZG4_9BACI|nr:hypothetical protein [Bacillus clarus]KFN03330.1 putative stage II sporulation protein B [Bacillus clarus]RFT65474.1 stage II sporulation protein B [Bacillus clarus]
MDKQSRTISVKVNGTEAKYEEKKKEKDEFEWMVVDSERTKNVVPFQKTKSSAIKQYRKKWSNVLMITVATAIIIGTAFGMGMLHLLTGQGETGQETITTSRQTNGEEKKPAGTKEKQQEEQKTQPQAGVALAPIKLYFVQGGLYSSEEKGQTALEEWKNNGGIAALKPNGDKYALVVGIASDEQTIDKLMEQYKKDGISVLKKNWEIADKAQLKDDKELGTFLTKVQSLYTHFVKYASSVQAGGKSNPKDVESIQKEWKTIEKEGKVIKNEDATKLYTYASVAAQTIKEGKNDKESVAKLNQVLIDGLLSYEKMVSEKAK